MPATELPEPLAALAARLQEKGFAVDEQPPSESFGDQLITFADERLRVRLTRDRGQWTIELGHPTWEDVYDPDVWRAALEGADPTQPTLEEQAAYVTGALDTRRATRRCASASTRSRSRARASGSARFGP